MPERDKFPREYFEGNPYEGESPEGTYQRVRWGNEPQEIFEIDAPEPLATIGDVALLGLEQGDVKFSEHEAPFLALGTQSNVLYIVPKDSNGEPVDVPCDGDWEYVGTMDQIDYYSDKGGEDAYYYHEHEPPYPSLYVHRASGVCMLVPSECDDGSKSYAVGDEGIIG